MALYAKMHSIFLGGIFVLDRGLKVSKLIIALLWSFALTSALSACGIKGPLYIPEKKYPQNVSAPQIDMRAQLHQLIANS
jgi:predicted small lipoprotein YifL